MRRRSVHFPKYPLNPSRIFLFWALTMAAAAAGGEPTPSIRVLGLLVRFSLRHNGVVIALACVAAGLRDFQTVERGTRHFPELSPKQVIIRTEAPGLSAEQVEILVSQPVKFHSDDRPGLVTAPAMLPIAFNSDNPGREIMGPIASIIIGGLFSSALLNLRLLPTFLLLYGDWSCRNPPRTVLRSRSRLKLDVGISNLY